MRSYIKGFILGIIIALVVLIVVDPRNISEFRSKTLTCFKLMYQATKEPISKGNAVSDIPPEEIVKRSFTDRIQVIKIYQMMKDVHELFAQYGITYWTDGGTTLGTIRHKGLIPWDNDIDIIVMHEDELKLQDLSQEFEDLGYYFTQPMAGLYRISSMENLYKEDYMASFPCLEVYIMRREKGSDRYVMVSEWFRELWPKEYYYENELLPLKKYKYGKLEVWGPKDPEAYFVRYYGPNWDKIAVIDPHHANPDSPLKEKFSFELTDEFCKPAEPTDQLLDRVSK